MLLREATDRELIERRDALLRQVEGINNEVARRYRERQAEQLRERSEWDRHNPDPRCRQFPALGLRSC